MSNCVSARPGRLAMLTLLFAAFPAMTSLAGNPAINGADTDLSIAVLGLGLGTVAAVATSFFGRDITAGNAHPAGDLAYN
jgi:hypothetical protein